jgi:5-methylcytosine-specific restriction endonuclease McrA
MGERTGQPGPQSGYVRVEAAPHLLETAAAIVCQVRRIDYDGPRYLPGRKQNPRYLIVGHIVSRHRARELGWPEARIHALANTQPECQSCSNRSGAKLGRQIQDQPSIFSQRPTTVHRW